MIEKASIIVGDDVWIGTGATFLPGVRVGAMSVIGAHSLVRGDVPAYSVVAGSPARVIRTLQESETRQIPSACPGDRNAQS
jgi:virginiamycin A acetyltransferase